MVHFSIPMAFWLFFLFASFCYKTDVVTLFFRIRLKVKGEMRAHVVVFAKTQFFSMEVRSSACQRFPETPRERSIFTRRHFIPCWGRICPVQ